MRRMPPAKVVMTAVSVAALAAGGAYPASSAAEDVDTETAGVVNKNGHEVDQHAADGQARAAAARAAAAARKAAKPAKAAAAEETAEPEEVASARNDNGNHGGPDDAAGDRPDENAFGNPQAREPRGSRDDPGSHARGRGPDDHAGDHPNAHATADHRPRKK